MSNIVIKKLNKSETYIIETALVGFLMSKVIKHNKDAVENARVLLEDGSYRSPTKEEKYEIAKIINWRCGSWAKLLLIIAIIILIAVICVINLFFK